MRETSVPLALVALVVRRRPCVLGRLAVLDDPTPEMRRRGRT